MKKTLILILTICAFAFAQSRQTIAVLPSVGDLEQQDSELLTDKIREIASKTLPQKQFMLLKLDAIINRVGAEELFRACKEGVCIGEIARKSSADFGARCDVFKRGDDFAIKFELYAVKEEEILETFTQYDVKDFREMLAILEARIPAAFQKVLDLYKPEPKPETYTPPPPKPDTVKTYTATVYASPLNGGTVSRSPYYNVYREGTAVTISAYPSFGYTFAGWVGTQTSNDNKITVIMNENVILTAQFQRIPEPPKLEPKPEPKRYVAEQTQKHKQKNKIASGTAIVFDIVGAGVMVYGLYENANVGKHAKDFNLTGAENAAKARNTAYIIGGALLVAGISIHIIF